MCAKVSTPVIAAVMLLVNLNCGLAKDWGSITIKPVEGSHEVVLENSQIRTVYKKSPNDWAGRHPTCMVEFYYKKIDRELIENGRWDDVLDPLNHSKKPPRPLRHYREALLSAEVVYDGHDRKTVRLNWKNSEEEVSIFPDSPVIQIDYLRWYVLITDWPNWPKGDDACKEQMFAVYGADKWHRTYDPNDTERTPGVGYNKMYFSHAERDAGKQGGKDPADGGPLNYKGYFIIGAYKTATGVGYGRIIPVHRINVLILWSYRAWEFFPTGKERFTTFLFPVSQGAREIIDAGKRIADANPILRQ
ncbi:MAG: hypothetical protein ACYTGS_12125 [Planctomycetota bacterium]|jgi:hypothetical protein